MQLTVSTVNKAKQNMRSHAFLMLVESFAS
jgi:hypothetical protein